MNFIERFTLISNDTSLEQLALANCDGLYRVDWLDCLSDFFFQGSVKNLSLNLRVGCLGSKSDNHVSSLSTHSLLDRSLNSLLSNNQWLESNQVTVGRNDIDDIIDFATVATDLSADVIGLVVVTDECGQSVLPDTFVNTESEDYVHLGKVTIEFLLCHFVHTADNVFIGLPESLSYFLKIPWRSWGTNGVPNLVLPLVTLLTCCCTCLYTNLFCHGIISGCVFAGATPLAGLRPPSPI